MAFFKYPGTLKNAPPEKDSDEEAQEEAGAGEEKVEEVPVELVIKILEVSEGKHCVEFTRKAGDQLEFFEEFAKIRDEIADITTTV